MDSCCDIENLLSPALFKALADPRRIGLLAHLAQCEGPRTVSALAEISDIDLSVVSRHLAMLRDAGILKAQKKGKEVLYQVRYNELARTLRAMAGAIEACCPEGECHEDACQCR